MIGLNHINAKHLSTSKLWCSSYISNRNYYEPTRKPCCFFVEMLAKQNATPEEKKIQALIKTALYGDNLLKFIDEVSKAFKGCGKVSVETVKGVTEYFKANSEVQIRNTDKDEEEKERLIKETSNRIVQGEVWVLGTLAHLGHLAE